MKSRVLSIVAVGATLAAAGAAYAQLNPKDAVGVRINAYRETGAAFKTINDQLKSGTPVKIMLRTSARTISNTARDQYNWFPDGSGAETGLKTKAKPVIWSDPAGFKAAQDRLAREADLMSKVIDTGDTAAMQKQAKALGQACAACHQKYRERED